MKIKLKSRKTLLLLGTAMIVVIAIALEWHEDSTTPRVPFAGLRQKAVLYDEGFQCGNGDYKDVRAYQLYPLDVKRWISSSSRVRWVRGPIKDSRYSKAFEWSTNIQGKYPNWLYEQWLKSDAFYFYLEDYEEFDGEMQGIVHYSTIWALDAKSYRLYYVSGRM